MALTVAAGPDSLLSQSTHRWATLWKVERTDGTKLLFTDHDTDIVFESERYEPAKGLDSTARRQSSGLTPHNLSVVGVISSDKITQADLRVGLYEDAKITETLVDWMYPWAGAIKTSLWWISELSWNGEDWEGVLEGQGRWLRFKKGGTFTRGCRHALGDGFDSGIGCQVDVGSLTVRNIRVSTVTDRKNFTANATDLSGSFTRDRFRFGKVIWLSGANEGFETEVRDYTPTGRAIETFLPTPYVINALDTFDFEPGCDKIRATCIGEYANIVDFGGFPFMPGTKAMLKKVRG